jgi:hypothetical protein
MVLLLFQWQAPAPALANKQEQQGSKEMRYVNMKHKASSDSLLQTDKKATNDTTAFDQTLVCKKPEPLTHYKWSTSMLQH